VRADQARACVCGGSHLMAGAELVRWRVADLWVNIVLVSGRIDGLGCDTVQ
jgi:hypothetical protein